MEDHLTNHQRLLMEVRDRLCGGNAAELARRIGKDSTYVNRLFYPEGKSGRKGIGLGVMHAVNVAFGLPRGFWDMDSPALDDRMLEEIRASQARRDSFLQGQRELSDAMTQLERGIRAGGFAAEPPSSYGMEMILAWEHPDDLPPGEFVMVPRLDVHLSAGTGHEQVEIDLVKENPQAFRTEWIRLMRLKPNKLAAMRASGESMEPTIHDTDSLLIDTSQVNVIDGKVYALWYDGGERVKRLFRLPGGGLRIVSDNPRFSPIELGPDYAGHVRIIGRVVHRSGTGGL